MYLEACSFVRSWRLKQFLLSHSTTNDILWAKFKWAASQMYEQASGKGSLTTGMAILLILGKDWLIQKIKFQELVAVIPSQQNIKGICISVLVIKVVLGLVTLSVFLMTPEDLGPRVHGVRMSLNNLTSDSLKPNNFNATWLSGKKIQLALNCLFFHFPLSTTQIICFLGDNKSPGDSFANKYHFMFCMFSLHTTLHHHHFTSTRMLKLCFCLESKCFTITWSRQNRDFKYEPITKLISTNCQAKIEDLLTVLLRWPPPPPPPP